MLRQISQVFDRRRGEFLTEGSPITGLPPHTELTVDTGTGTPPIVDMGAYEFRSADCDNSGGVNLMDLADLDPCLLGPGASVSPECACFDLNNDGVADLGDVALFQQVFDQP